MKRARRFLALLLVPLSTCGKEVLEPEMGDVEAIVVTPAISTVSIGSHVDLDAEVLDASGVSVPGRQVHWASENPDIASVSSDGDVTAHKIGVVHIAASAGGRSGLAEVTVTTLPVASVSVSPTNRSLFVEESFQFTAQARDASGNVLPDRPITWSSNNESVATVSPSGRVTGLSPGGAIITATAEGRSTPASVTVAAVPVAAIRLQPPTLTLTDGQTAQLQAQPLDSDGKPLPGRVILWFTNNASVATVTAAGLVTAQSPGTAVITATSEGKSATSSVTVNAPAPNVVVLTPAQVLVQEGSTAPLTAQVLDNLGRPLPGAPVTYSSSNAGVATVSAAGVITGVAPGKATITASSGGKSGTAEVTVTAIPVATVTVTPSQPTVVVGRSVTLNAQALSASGQPLSGRPISWSSSAPNIAAVSSSGVVTGAATGSAVIFANVDGVLGWTTVTVVPVPGTRTITITPPSATINVLGTVTLTAVVHDPSGAVINASVTWSTSNALVAGVSSSGTVTGLLPGTATITAKSDPATATAAITVK